MRFTKLWLTLGILCFIAAIVLFCVEVFISGDYWCWITWAHFETGVSLAVFVGATLLIVMAVERWWKK
jgi:hypothetical protein